MPTSAVTDLVENECKQRRWESRVATQVLKRLGTPPHLYDVQVCHVSGSSYRVNVRVRYQSSQVLDLGQVEIPHSYFCVVNCHGDLLECDPEIKKRY